MVSGQNFILKSCDSHRMVKRTMHIVWFFHISLHHPWCNFEHSNTMTFLYLNIYTWPPSLTLVQFSIFKHDAIFALKTFIRGAPPFSNLGSNFNIQMWWPFCTWTCMCGPLHHPWFKFQYLGTISGGSRISPRWVANCMKLKEFGCLRSVNDDEYILALKHLYIVPFTILGLLTH